MAKLTLGNVSSFSSSLLTTINSNSDLIEAALENTLSRDGTSPNQLTADLDLNTNDILNAGSIGAESLTLNGIVVSVTPNEEVTPESLGLEIGVDVQAYDSDLTAFAGKTAPSGAVVGTTDSQTLTNKTLTSPSITTPTGIVKGDVGLGNVDNTSDANKPVSSATTTQLNLKAPIASPTFTGTVSGVTASMVGLGNVDNTSDANKPVSTATTTQLNLKAPLASPTFTGTVSGITKTMVGLGSVDNTADTAKPVSTAQQTAINLKADVASPTFTGTITPGTGGIVGVANNTSPAAGVVGETIDGTLASGSATSLVTGTAKTVISISLTAGDWEVSGVAYIIFGLTTSYTSFLTSISQTTNTLDLTPGKFTAYSGAAQVPGNVTSSLNGPLSRISLSSTTTIYLVVQSSFTVSTMTSYGFIHARRLR